MAVRSRGIAGRKSRFHAWLAPEAKPRRQRFDREPCGLAAEVLEERTLMTLLAPDDLVGYYAGEWYVSRANTNAIGPVFANSTTALWAKWADVAWDALGQADFNGDNLTDIYGMIDGEWYVGISNGSAFVTSLWGKWAGANYENIHVGDLNYDGRADVVAEYNGQWYQAFSTGTKLGPHSLGTVTANVNWDRTFLVDATGDGRDDLMLLLDGVMYGAVATGTAFDQSTIWAKFADVPFQLVSFADFNADQKLDLALFRQGEWYTGNSTGAAFDLQLTAKWSATAAWDDPTLIDINADGRSEILARTRGDWYIGLNIPVLNRIETSPLPWEQWADADWEDIRVGDFNGDGFDDIAGRLQGAWYVALSVGTVSHRFTTWADVDWKAVGTVQADYWQPTAIPEDLPDLGLGELRLEETIFSPINIDEDLTELFWSESPDNGVLDDLLGGLLGGILGGVVG